MERKQIIIFTAAVQRVRNAFTLLNTNTRAYVSADTICVKFMRERIRAQWQNFNLT